MNWKIKSVLLVFSFLWSCQNAISDKATSLVLPENTIIEAKELLSIIDLPSTKLIDLRAPELYAQSHIVNAINITRSDIENHQLPYSGVMPDKAQVEALFSRLGIENTDTLILYDDKGLCEATRLWWILHNYNYHNVQLLDGGIESWIGTNGTTSRELPYFRPSSFKLKEPSHMKHLIKKEEVLAALETDAIIIDTRTLDEYSGKLQKPGAKKAGRIPNSVHIDWANNINFHGDFTLKSKEAIEKNYAHLNLKKSDLIIVYCHSGVRSSHTTFVLSEILGYDNVKNYDGSWVEWSYFDDTPIEKDTF
jgi:thiosulfate/3-mercaptopyruvate sulfurtransferase